MTPKEIFEKLKERFGEAKVVEYAEPIGDPFVVVAAESLLEIAKALRDDPEFALDFCSNVTALDWPEEKRLESVLHLYSMEHGHGLTLKVRVPRDKPVVPSVAGIWPAADWHEREQFDMLGVEYAGHPNLRRILLAEDWEGFPLRKDYVSPEEIHGVSNLP